MDIKEIRISDTIERIRKDPSKILFFSDMDGTLLSKDKKLSEKNMTAIRRLVDRGGKFIVATGRVIQATRHYFRPMGLDLPCILCNGGMIYDCAQNKVMWSRSLDTKLARRHIRQLLDAFPDVCAEICTPDCIYDVQINEEEKAHWKMAGFTAEIMDSLDDVPDGEWSKVLFAVNEKRIPAFAEYCMTLEGYEKAEYVTSGHIFHEMLPKNCTKGEAMLRLIDIYGLQDCFTVAMGDYDNDVEMLENANLAACPVSARDSVKKVSDIITDTDNDGGSVADVIDLLLD